MVNEALGAARAIHDLTGDGVVNVVDIQIVQNAVASAVCVGTAPPAVLDLRYGYDADDNIHTISDALYSPNSQTLTYDALDQLLTAASGTGGYGSQTFTYDANGNRTSFNGAQYTIAGVANRITAIGTASVLSGPTGNIGQIGAAQTMAYDHDDRMTGSTNGTSFTYKFDAFDQRLTAQPSGNSAQVYQFDLGGRLLTETNNGIETDYVYIGLTPIATIRPSTGEIDYIHADNIGRPVLATNASQSPSWMAAYDPFGNAVVSGNPAGPTPTINLRFPGQYADGSGFYRNGVRDYDSTQGRYLQFDRIGLGGGLNPYAYAGNNPLRYSDRTGKCIEDACVVELAVILELMDVEAGSTFAPLAESAITSASTSLNAFAIRTVLAVDNNYWGAAFLGAGYGYAQDQLQLPDTDPESLLLNPAAITGFAGGQQWMQYSDLLHDMLSDSNSSQLPASQQQPGACTAPKTRK